MILFRCDKTYGNAGHTPAEILAYETINLGNVWILKDLRNKYDSYLTQETKSDIDWLLSAINEDIVKVNDEGINYSPYVDTFKGLINAIEKCEKIKINYLLWLTDMNSLLDLYYNEACIDYINDIDAYQTGLELIHFEGDGNLYAYEDKPVCLGKSFVQDALDNAKGIYKVFIWPGVGYNLQPIYFDHQNINIAEIAEYCVRNNAGWVLDDADYIFETGSLDSEDERFVYVDLSEVGLNNVWLCVEEMRPGEGVEIYS